MLSMLLKPSSFLSPVGADVNYRTYVTHGRGWVKAEGCFRVPLSQAASSPSLPVLAQCSLDGCRLMDESPLSSSVKAPLYQAATTWAHHIWLDPSGSQFLLVIAHSAEAGDAAEAAIRAQRLMRWGSHFDARSGYYVTHVKLGLTLAVLPPAREEAGMGRSGISLHPCWCSEEETLSKMLPFT